VAVQINQEKKRKIWKQDIAKQIYSYLFKFFKDLFWIC
jgi:hypothetical protein